MKVRDARQDDNEALVALAAQCPMNGDLSLCVDRRPDFFALNRIAGDPWRVGVIDGDDGPIACVGVARRAVYLDGAQAQLGYVGDLKVHPAHRRQGAARALVSWATNAAREMVGEGDPLMATVLGGNSAVDTLEREYKPAVHKWATIRSHSISLLWRRRLSRGGLSIRAAQEADVPAMLELWRRLASNRQFAPVCDSFPLAVSGLDYLVARRPDGTLAGFVGLWDQHSIKQMRVNGYSARMRAARVAFNLAAPVFGAPPLPAPGGKLSYRTVVNLCASEPEVLRALLLDGCERLRGRYSFLTIGLDTRDPLSEALSGMLAQPTDVDVLVLGGPAGRDAPVHFEIATV